MKILLCQRYETPRTFDKTSNYLPLADELKITNASLNRTSENNHIKKKTFLNPPYCLKKFLRVQTYHLRIVEKTMRMSIKSGLSFSQYLSLTYQTFYIGRSVQSPVKFQGAS